MGVSGESQTPLQQGRNPPQAYLGTGLVTCLPAGSVAHSGLKTYNKVQISVLLC